MSALLSCTLEAERVSSYQERLEPGTVAPHITKGPSVPSMAPKPQSCWPEGAWKTRPADALEVTSETNTWPKGPPVLWCQGQIKMRRISNRKPYDVPLPYVIQNRNHTDVKIHTKKAKKVQICFWYFFPALLKCDIHTYTHSKYSMLSFGGCIQVYDLQHHSRDTEHFQHPESSLMSLCNWSPAQTPVPGNH